MKRVLLTLLGLLTALSALYAQQQAPSPLQNFAQGVSSEFSSSLVYIVPLIGTIFVFTWLVSYTMRSVRRASR